MKYEDHPVKNRAVVLVVGDSGSGKTTLLASAANAGYKVRILDTEGKLSVLKKHLTPEGSKNLSYMTFKDEIGKTATAYKAFNKIISNGWVDGNEDLGKIQTWGPDTILAIDSGTGLGELMKHEALAIDGQKAHEQLSPGQWYAATRTMTTFLEYLPSNHLNCHVVVTALPQAVDDDNGITKFYPMFITKAFSTNSGAFFDNMVLLRKGKEDAPIIRTVSDNRWSLKNIALKLDKEIPADLPALLKAITP